MDDLMLPEPIATIGNWGRVEWAYNVFPQLGDKMFTAEQLREYAKEAVEAERDRVRAEELLEIFKDNPHPEVSGCVNHR